MGYLPNTPYHLISDAEMCDAFIRESDGQLAGYFADNYPLANSSLSDAYDKLVAAIFAHIQMLKDDPTYILPDWVQAYMLGSVISDTSSIDDKHDLLVLLECDNLYDDFTPLAQSRCYEVSQMWVRKYLVHQVSDDGVDLRPPTVFGEPHVIKSLRLSQV